MSPVPAMPSEGDHRPGCQRHRSAAPVPELSADRLAQCAHPPAAFPEPGRAAAESGACRPALRGVRPSRCPRPRAVTVGAKSVPYGPLGSGSTPPPTCCPPTAAAGRRARSALSPAPGLFHGSFQPRWGSGGRGQGSQHRSAIWGLVQASLFCRLLLRACCPPGTCSCLRPASCRVAFSHPFTALRSFCLYVAWLGRASETRVPAPTHAHVRTRHVRTASPSSAVFPSPEGVF